MKTLWILSIIIIDPILMDAFPELYIHYKILTFIIPAIKFTYT